MIWTFQLFNGPWKYDSKPTCKLDHYMHFSIFALHHEEANPTNYWMSDPYLKKIQTNLGFLPSTKPVQMPTKCFFLINGQCYVWHSHHTYINANAHTMFFSHRCTISWESNDKYSQTKIFKTYLTNNNYSNTFKEDF